MKKIDIVNEQKEINKVLTALENNNKAQARRELNKVLKSARNKYDYLNKNIEIGKYQGAMLQVAKAERKEAEKNLNEVKKSVGVIRKYIKSPRYVRINKSVNRLNTYVAKQKAIQEVTKGKSIITIKATEKMEILITRLIYENTDVYNIDENKLNEIDKITIEHFKWSIKDDILKIFDTEKHFESGDEHDPLYEIVDDFNKKVKNAMNNKKYSDEALAEIEHAYKLFYEGVHNI